jgi:hypothetical protein
MMVVAAVSIRAAIMRLAPQKNLAGTRTHLSYAETSKGYTFSESLAKPSAAYCFSSFQARQVRLE